ncbi:hypothetical protein BT96DRAFT_963543 [Gymnopus androsaceus JB14]|uniref:N-acetyltransferase domain-containing protein n=1 Tax=Gymnopus androsaceus JB14 TaxID=1447944 RepID=A0A6A4I6W8_9AGAR|nr:hypothetical protein BT96DRAFT_963543 [Gymnopus androsaceus JB14]
MSFSSEKDTNFCFPIPDVLENDKVQLVPFIRLVEGFDANTWNYLSYGPFEILGESACRANHATTTFTILDKVGPLAVNGEPVIAGMVSYINSSDADACTEIGFVVVLPQFHRTHVTSNHAGGLGLRRLQWVCNTKNYPSLKVAERMGFRFEGVLRWSRVVPPKKAIGYKAAPERKGDPRAGNGGRDSAFSSCCWDDWEGGVREWVDKVMARNK